MDIKTVKFDCLQNKQNTKVNNTIPTFGMLNKDTLELNGKNNSSTRSSGFRDFIMNTLFGTKKFEKLVPKHKGIIYKKIKDTNGKVINKIPVEVDIVKTKPDKFEFQHNGEFVGSVQLSYISDKKCSNDSGDEFYKNYIEEGVVGDRIKVDFIENKKAEEYCGIGHLADLIEVACCNELGFEPNVVSESLPEVAPLHYLRGKRFIPFEKYCNIYKRFMHEKEPNEIVKEIVEKTPKGEPFDTSAIKYNFIMYMPKEMIKELEEELKEHPIF